MKEVSESIHVETRFRGCNVGCVVTTDGLVLIDTPQRPTDALKWKNELDRKGVIKYIINTEHHGDHVLGNFFFPGIVIAHQGTKENASVMFDNMEQIVARVKDMDPEGVHLLSNYVPNEPKITLDSRLTLYLGNDVLELINLPGHTPNETVVLIPNRGVIFTGDNVVYRVRPAFHDCSPKTWVESLEAIKAMDFEVLVPGHGEVCDKRAIDEMISYIQEIFDQVKMAIERGLTKQEALEQVQFDDRMPLAEHQKARWPEMRRLGVFRIYDELTS